MVMIMVSYAGANEAEENGEDEQHFEVVYGELEEDNYLTWEGQSHCWRELPNYKPPHSIPCSLLDANAMVESAAMI